MSKAGRGSDLEGESTHGNSSVFGYTNRKGVTYFVHANTTKIGKTRYVLKRSAEGALDALPDGYEVVENVNARASVRRKRPRQITAEEESEVQAALGSHGLTDYRVEVKEDCITVFEPNCDPEEIVEAYDPLHLGGGLADTFQAMLREQLGEELVDRYIRQKNEEMQEALRRHMRFFPVLRFRLVDAEKREFVAERMTYFGEGGWWSLAALPLTKAVKRYVKHLGKESFFELL